MLWYGSRHYDPELGRFIQPDTIVPLATQGTQALDRYAYANNNAVRYTDPTGHAADDESDGSGAGCIKRYGSWEYCRGAYTTKPPQSFRDWNSDEYGGCFKCHAAKANGQVALTDEQLAQAYSNITTWQAIGYTPMIGVAAAVATAEAAPMAVYACMTNPLCAAAVGAGPAGGGQGFSTFNKLKQFLGGPGENNAWHHVVEQSQITKSGFTPQQIHNVDNVLSVEQTVHAQISGFYSSIRPFTDGLRVRDWLAGQSFSTQYEFGLQVLRDFGVIK